MVNESIRERKVQENGGNYIMRSFIIYKIPLSVYYEGDQIAEDEMDVT
jgi:hypothetical protein